MGEDYRGATRRVLIELPEGRMAQRIDQHFERMAEIGAADRRNGCYRRHPLTELGQIELTGPRTRTFSALKAVRPTPGAPRTSIGCRCGRAGCRRV